MKIIDNSLNNNDNQIGHGSGTSTGKRKKKTWNTHNWLRAIIAVGTIAMQASRN